MAKPLTLKQMAQLVTDRVVDGFREGSTEPDRTFDLSALRIKLHKWIEKVSNVTIEELDAAEVASTRIAIDDIEYLPSDLRIIKEYRNTAAADPLIEAHDKKKSHHLPVEKMFTPSLFPKLDYEEARIQYLILGESTRVLVANATPEHWSLWDKIKDDNFEAQTEARKKDIAVRKRRKDLWRRHADCRNTDDLMKTLGAWA